MMRGQSNPPLEPPPTLFGVGTVAGLNDGQLLDRFAAGRDTADAEAAFAALVAWHGPMVRRVCRSLLADPHDAEDVFQATFLVLALKAGTIRRPELLGNWLNGTAHRTARKLKVRSARRLKYEAREAAMAGARISTDADGLERQAARREEAQFVHEEVARLPEGLRAAVVLCDLEGQRHEEAARRLRCSDRTLRRRLGRARDLLRARLTRRGLDPTAIAAAFGPEPASAGIPQITADATARAAVRFAAGRAAVGAASTLAEGVTMAMFWTRLKGIAVALAVVLAIGVGAGMSVGPGFAAQDAEKRAAAVAKSGAGEAPGPELRTPSEQFRALVKDYDDAMTAQAKLAEMAKNRAELEEIYKDQRLPEQDFNPRFLALAERHPNDPAAVDALVWIVEKTTRYMAGPHRDVSVAIDRSMKTLARGHLGDVRLGPLCLELIHYPSPSRDDFLRAVAERSPDRVVRGRAILALAQYLNNKGELARDLKKPDGQIDERLLSGMYGPEYLAQLRAADPDPMFREADRLLARVSEEYGEVAFILPNARPTRETLADVVRRERPNGPVADPLAQFRSIEKSFNVALKAADRAADEAWKKAVKAEPGEEDVRAYIAAYPKWGDYGPKLWRLAQDSPRHQAAFEALIWLVEKGPRFFDAKAERDAVMSRVVDALIRDHLATIAEHLADRNVATALDSGDQLPTPYRERLLRALFERGSDRATRGRMGLLLGRSLRVEADCIARLIRPDADSRRRWDLYLLEPAFADRLRGADREAIGRQAEDVLKRVIAVYGDIVHANGGVAAKETLAALAEREVSEIRSLSVGKQAPEITGEDIAGEPMKLSEFRGKVVLLDFGSHEHCGPCVRAYPLMRSTLERLHGRPFVILGINNHDRLDALKQAISRGEITWRCWWDGDKLDDPGPITTSWNVRSYPTYFLIDHRGVIRSKADLHPLDSPSFDGAIEALLKEAEGDGSRR